MNVFLNVHCEPKARVTTIDFGHDEFFLCLHCIKCKGNKWGGQTCKNIYVWDYKLQHPQRYTILVLKKNSVNMWIRILKDGMYEMCATIHNTIDNSTS